MNENNKSKIEIDDEEVTEEEEVRVKQAKEEIARGEYFTHEQVFRKGVE